MALYKQKWGISRKSGKQHSAEIAMNAPLFNLGSSPINAPVGCGGEDQPPCMDANTMFDNLMNSPTGTFTNNSSEMTTNDFDREAYNKSQKDLIEKQKRDKEFELTQKNLLRSLQFKNKKENQANQRSANIQNSNRINRNNPDYVPVVPDKVPLTTYDFNTNSGIVDEYAQTQSRLDSINQEQKNNKIVKQNLRYDFNLNNNVNRYNKSKPIDKITNETEKQIKEEYNNYLNKGPEFTSNNSFNVYNSGTSKRTRGNNLGYFVNSSQTNKK